LADWLAGWLAFGFHMVKARHGLLLLLCQLNMANSQILIHVFHLVVCKFSTGSKVIEAAAEMLKAFGVLGWGMALVFGFGLGSESGPKAGQ